MPNNVCGYEKDDGEPCQRPAGWGTPSELGHCKDHSEEYRVPRKLDEETRQTIIGAAQTGAFKRDIANIAGIARSTLHDWLERGERHSEDGMDTPLADFYRTFQRTRGAGAVSRLREVDPEFVLERSYGYTKTERREHLVDDDAELSQDATAEFVTYESDS